MVLYWADYVCGMDRIVSGVSPRGPQWESVEIGVIWMQNDFAVSLGLTIDYFDFQFRFRFPLMLQHIK